MIVLYFPVSMHTCVCVWLGLDMHIWQSIYNVLGWPRMPEVVTNFKIEVKEDVFVIYNLHQ